MKFEGSDRKEEKWTIRKRGKRGWERGIEKAEWREMREEENREWRMENGERRARRRVENGEWKTERDERGGEWRMENGKRWVNEEIKKRKKEYTLPHMKSTILPLFKMSTVHSEQKQVKWRNL